MWGRLQKEDKHGEHKGSVKTVISTSTYRGHPSSAHLEGVKMYTEI